MAFGRTVFLIDSDTLIEASQKFYTFNFAPGFWRFMKGKIDDGSVIILDKVYHEIVNEGNDELSKWLLNIQQCPQISYKELDIVETYRKIVNYIKNSDFYTSLAFDNWSKDNIADPWIVACAKVKSYIVVTFESANSKNLNVHSKSKNPKIPDVCDTFGVKWTNLYGMLRELNFTL